MAHDLAALQARAANFNSVVSVPLFETTPEAVALSVTNTITQANAALDAVGRLEPGKVSFDNTIRTLDDVSYGVSLTANRLELMKETSTNAAIRDAATEGVKVLQEWAVGIDYREDVYAAAKAYALTQPRLEGEDKKLFTETMRDYRRAGLELPKADRAEVEKMRKELSGLTTDFESNVTKAKQAVKFSKAELDGVPDSFLTQEGVKSGADEYTVMANITYHFVTVMENARRESTRKALETAHDNLARDANLPLLQQILVLRDRIATRLGYATWADYEIEPKMAKTATAAREFLQKLKLGLQPKFDAEVNELRALKVKETGDPNATIQLWDWRYFGNQLKKEKYTVDAEQLRVFFPYEKVLAGMFTVYQRIFGLVIEPVDAPYRWVQDLKLFAVSDAGSGEPLGLFYLDMFPRDGKYNHFAQFGIIEGKRLSDGRYQRPTVSLVCNFPIPQKDKPSLLTHRDVETLFHEFGHALHSILTRAKYGRFAGTSVPRDFVEAPSQMLENWVWDKKILDSFAADYRAPSKKIPPEILAKLKEAKLGTVAVYYRRQLSFGLMDLTLHMEVKADQPKNAAELSNQILGDVFFPAPPGTAFVAYFGHLMGYDAGYYGYAWADAIAADMATVFESAPEGFFDAQAGARLRREIYEPGDSREVGESISKFLGRPQSIEPFLKTLGLTQTGTTARAR